MQNRPNSFTQKFGDKSILKLVLDNLGGELCDLSWKAVIENPSPSTANQGQHLEALARHFLAIIVEQNGGEAAIQSMEVLHLLFSFQEQLHRTQFAHCEQITQCQGFVYDLRR